MNLRSSDKAESRFADYVEGLAGVIGHADRNGPLRDYCVGLLLPCERKSVEPMAACTAPTRTSAQHQKLVHFVGVAPWSDEPVLAKICEMVLPSIECHGPIEAWIIDDTSFPKKGTHSVGVTRQYCGHLGKQDNCQVAVSLSLANRHASLPVAYRLYLTEDWSVDSKRRHKAGVPADIGFATKPQIALSQISVKELALGLPMRAWRTIEWREGTAHVLFSRFARVRVRSAHRDYNLTEGRAEESLLIEWPKGGNEPTKYWLSTLPKTTSFDRLVDLAKLRWHRARLSGTEAGGRAGAL